MAFFPRWNHLSLLGPEWSVWRAGANEATTISFSAEVSVEGQTLPAGTYGLFMIPGPTEWTIILSKRARQWGSFSYNRKEDALRTKVAPSTDSHQEGLVYDFPMVGNEMAHIALRWEKMKVVFEVSAEEALKWINAAPAFQESGSNFLLKAKILVELKRIDEAIEIGDRVAKTYREKNQLIPAEAAERLLAEWKKLKQQ